jgi:hypothetical protein
VVGDRGFGSGIGEGETTTCKWRVSEYAIGCWDVQPVAGQAAAVRPMPRQEKLRGDDEMYKVKLSGGFSV